MSASQRPQQSSLASVLLAPGFRLPFFPMRPRHGHGIRYTEDLSDLLSDHEYDWSLKLNGDRICVGVIDGTVVAQNRKGSWYKMTIDNLGMFENLPGAWLMDGEVFKKSFYPFEIVIAGGKNLISCPKDRKSAARQLCSRLRLAWMYGIDPADILQQGIRCLNAQDSTIYEGIVGKRVSSPYIPLGTESAESPAWIKHKW